MSNKTPSVSVNLVITDGKVDPTASTQAFNDVMTKYINETETEQTTIASAVNSVLDEQKGSPIKIPVLTGFATMKLNAQKENYESLSKRVHQYVSANTQGKKAKDGSFERPTSLFVSGKGKGGGVRLRSALPANEPETDGDESESDSE